MLKRSFYMLVLLFLGTSLAQPMRSLGHLAPADTVASFAWSSQTEFIDSLATDLVELDWMQAGETLEKLANVLSEAGDFAEFAEMFEILEQMNDQNEMLDEAYDEIYDFCPNLETVVPELEAIEGTHVPFNALLTVGISSFNPIPSVTAILEIDESIASLLVEARESLLVCLQDSGDVEISTLDQDGVPLYVIGDAGDFPVVAGSFDNLFFIGTNPESLRGIIRKANGNTEESFADSRMYQEMSTRFNASGNHLNFSLDLAKLADTAEGFAGFVIDGPETEYLVNRGLAMLRTLGGVAGQITVSHDGLVSESIWTVNPAGGDDALAEYILCQHCTVSRPFLAPSGAISVSSAYIPWRELHTYAETWVSDLEEITGEQVDLKKVLAEEFGFDLDVALFNWLGSEFHSVVLEPISPDIRTLLYDPGQFLFIPVSSVEAAEAGIAELQDSVAPVLFELMNEFDVADDLPGDFSMPELENMVAVRPYTYKGTDIHRVQFSLNADLGYAFVGNYLVLGSPARSIEAAIDTFMGGRTIMRDDLYANVRNRADVPPDVTIFSVSEDQSSMHGLADILQSISQPLAFAVATGLETGLNDELDSFFEDDFFESFPADIDGISAEPFSPPGDLLGTIEDDELDNLGNLTDFYELTDLSVGDTVTVNLSSEDFDTYLFLLDANSEDYLDENDDMGDLLASELSFTVEEGKSYWVEVTSFDGASTGDYVLTVFVSNGDAMTNMDSDDMMEMHVEAPGYAELLDFFDLLPASVRVLAEHLSTSEGFSTIDGETVYSRSKTHIVW